MKKILLVFFAAASLLTATAQDPHFSQFYAAPLTLNPALTGAFAGNYRIGGLFRSQWGSILHNESVPMYRTYTASADFRTNKGFMAGDAFGFGLSFMEDRASESKLGLMRAGLSLAYFKSLNRKNTHYIALGFQSEMYNATIDYSNLQWGQQWDGDAYNPNLPTGEFLASDNLLYWDVSTGLLWYMQIAKRTNVYVGFAAYHLNRPKISFLGDNSVQLNMKFMGHLGVRFPLGDPDRSRVDMQPKAIAMFQGQSMEFNFGTDFRVLFEERKPEGSNFRIGAMFRMVGGDKNAPWRDKVLNSEAVILTAGVDWMGASLGLAYDINVSELAAASRTRGAFEIALSYVGAFKKRGPQTIYCPRF